MKHEEPTLHHSLSSHFSLISSSPVERTGTVLSTRAPHNSASFSENAAERAGADMTRSFMSEFIEDKENVVENSVKGRKAELNRSGKQSIRSSE